MFMKRSICLLICLIWLNNVFAGKASTAITDHTNYNVGSPVLIRLAPGINAIASIRYGGESKPIESNIHLNGAEYESLWNIPWNARTGRYEVDLSLPDGKSMQRAASFAVHRQLAKVIAFDLDKTFYTAGDAVNPRIVVRNISNQRLEHLQVEFEAYTYPWIARAADESPSWKTIAAKSLSLEPRAEKEFRLANAATVQAKDQQTNIYFSAIIRDSEQPDRIYDLAFALPAITAPLEESAPKQYPSLYLYSNLKEVPASESYRHFYPAAFVSDVVSFDQSHTMFPAGGSPVFSFAIKASPQTRSTSASAEIRVVGREGKILERQKLNGPVEGSHRVMTQRLGPGLYTLEVAVQSAGGITVASNRLDFAVDTLPKSILIFCAHEDDDTAHPEIIRAAVENNIPLHVVYFTSGDAGGCDRYYMHSCDAERAMDFGEVRMNEARASLKHLGVSEENIFFLGLPDGGMEQIWARNQNSDKPYLSVLLASEHSPYRDSAVPNLPYARDAVLRATKDFIVKYKPALIITGHPDERHVDHRTNNWIVVKAMQELLHEGALPASTELLVDAAYGPGPQKHAPYKYEKFQFYVSGEVAMLGQEATWYYQSQDGNHQQAHIVPYDKLQRDAPAPHYGDYHWPYPHFKILDWQSHEGWNE
jgi:LmbE family N-acetylglucosaminyl deacetylase